MKAVLLFSALFLSGPLPAEAKGQKSVSTLVNSILANGKDAPLNANMAAEFGLGSKEIPGRKISFKAAESPDGRTHAFQVLYELDATGNRKPTAIVLTVGKSTGEGPARLLDGYVFLGTLAGKLKEACHNTGPANDLTAEKVPTNASIQKLFRDELSFYRGR